MIKLGDKLLCINFDATSRLNINEVYTIFKIVDVFIYIRCVKGIESSFHERYLNVLFILYNEWLALERNKKIDSILE
jgi:hypothetical protein